MTPWLRAVAAGLGVLVALEVPFLLLRRQLVKLRLVTLYHLWSLSIAAVAFLIAAGGIARWPRVWQAAAGAAIVHSALGIYLLLSGLLLKRPHGPRGTPIVPKLVRDVGGWIVFVAAGLIALTALDIAKLDTIVVSSTVLSAVVGFALQDVLKNLFAGMALQTERPFAVGDWLLLDGTPMQVMEMSWRATHLRNNDGHLFVEPNAMLASQRLVNLGGGDRPVAWAFRIGLPYETPPARARTALLAAARGADGVAPFPEPTVFLESFADSSVVYRLRVWTTAPEAILRFTDAVNGRIWYELQRQGISIPFPIRTVELHRADELAAQRESAELARRRSRLDALPLFAELPEEARAHLAAAARRQFFDHGEHLMREGEAGDSLLVIDRGRVMVSKSGAKLGTSTIDLATLEAGEFLGELSLLTGAPRSATATSEGGSEVLVLDRAAIAPVLAADPALAETLSRVLAERVTATVARFEDRRDRPAQIPEGSDQASLLRRIRALFRL